MAGCCSTHPTSESQKPKDTRFKALGRPGHIWSVSAIHGHIEKLTAIHDAVYERFAPGDRIVYHGNYTGHGPSSREIIDELLTFRRLLLAQRGVVPSDITYLRGNQEEMFQKLLQLQFASDPANVLLWMLGNGMAPALQSYDISAHDGIEACRKGVVGIGKWTESIRQAIRKNPGHEIFGAQYVRAAYTDEASDYPMLFVNSGIDAAKALPEQGDNFWWPRQKFEDITHAYKPFEKVVRGYDPAHKGFHANCVTATIDGGCGFGGALIAAEFENGGNLGNVLEA